MAKLKNYLLMGLSLVLVAVIAIGGTVAYLTDTDSGIVKKIAVGKIPPVADVMKFLVLEGA